MSQFGGATADGDYGYFGSQKPAAPTTQFGGGSTARPTFGAPAQGSAGFGYGGPPAYSPSPKTRRRWPLVVGLVLLGAVVLLFVGSRVWESTQLKRPIVIPTTLSGLKAVKNKQLKSGVTQMEASLRTANPGAQVDAGGYGGTKGFEALAVLRGRVNVDDELAGFASTYSRGSLDASHKEGRSTCVGDAAHAVTFCVRTSRTLTVEVLSLKEPPGKASAAVDEAWALQ